MWPEFKNGAVYDFYTEKKNWWRESEWPKQQTKRVGVVVTDITNLDLFVYSYTMPSKGHVNDRRQKNDEHAMQRKSKSLYVCL